MSDRRKVKVLNMERPGEQIEIVHNGNNYIVQHGATVSLPGGVIALLKDAKIKRHPRTYAYSGVKAEDGWFQRFEIMEYDLPEEEATPKQKKRGKLAEDLDGK
jgi:hypothetical protein